MWLAELLFWILEGILEVILWGASPGKRKKKKEEEFNKNLSILKKEDFFLTIYNEPKNKELIHTNKKIKRFIKNEDLDHILQYEITTKTFKEKLLTLLEKETYKQEKNNA